MKNMSLSVTIATSHTTLVKCVFFCTLTSKFGDEEDAVEVSTMGSLKAGVHVEVQEEEFILMIIMQYQNMSLLLQ